MAKMGNGISIMSTTRQAFNQREIRVGRCDGRPNLIGTMLYEYFSKSMWVWVCERVCG